MAKKRLADETNAGGNKVQESPKRRKAINTTVANGHEQVLRNGSNQILKNRRVNGLGEDDSKQSKKARGKGPLRSVQRQSENETLQEDVAGQTRREEGQAGFNSITTSAPHQQISNGDFDVLTTLQEVSTEDVIAKEDNHMEEPEPRKAKGQGLQGRNSVSKHGRSKWQVSESAGGNLLSLDPILGDKSHILIAFATFIGVFDVTSSILLRKLNTPGRRISAMAQCCVFPQRVYVGVSSGHIEQWDWQTGKQETTYFVSGTPRILAVSQTERDKLDTLVYAACEDSPKSWSLVSVTVKSELNEEAEIRMLQTNTRSVRCMQVSGLRRYIIMISANSIILGKYESSTSDMCTWRSIECPASIICMDAMGMNLSADERQDPINLAIGCEDGVIHIYEDLESKLLGLERGSKRSTTTPFTSRRLHWHRGAVASLKWSEDGNYLFSGGLETVLVFWQLDSGRHPFLPHLGAPLTNIVNTDIGIILVLANNAAMILSNADLKPMFRISGIQVQSKYASQSRATQHVKSASQHPSKNSIAAPLTACVHSLRPSCLLTATKSIQGVSKTNSSSASAVHLQTIDLGLGLQSTKQALTRTRITDRPIDRTGSAMQEPNVTHIACSQDGRWLASVEVWDPPDSLISELCFDRDREQDEKIFRQEVFLKLWAWQDESQTWALSSRIDDPHPPPLGSRAQRRNILSLASDPIENAFATVGCDGLLKIWTSAPRKRHGLDVRDQTGQELMDWSCQTAVCVYEISSADVVPSIQTAYSPDGSVIATGRRGVANGSIILVDVDDASVKKVLSGIHPGALLQLEIIDRYLVILSDTTLMTWDLVDDKTHIVISLDIPSRLSFENLLCSSHIAVNLESKTFAVTVPHEKSRDNGHVGSLLAVFAISHTEPVLVHQFPSATQTLLPATEDAGYVMLDESAQVRRIIHAHGTETRSSREDLIVEDLQSSQNHPHHHAQPSLPSLNTEEQQIATSDSSNATPPLVPLPDISADKLASIFNSHPEGSIPAVSDLFQKVAALMMNSTASAA